MASAPLIPYLCGTIAALAILSIPVDDAESGTRLPTHRRRPVAMAPSADGQWLYVANHRSGTVSVIDLRKQAFSSEIRIGRNLSDLASDSRARRLLVLDESDGELLRVAVEDSTLRVIDRIPISGTPVRMALTADGQRCVVTSLWGRMVSVIKVSDDSLNVEHRIVVPFNPREVLLVPDTTKAIIADAFGGQLGVVDIETGKLESARELPAHNLGGLALSSAGDAVLVTHQTLASLAQTTRDDIHWGNLLTNNLRVIPLKDILNANADLLRNSRVLPLGDVGRGAADPAGIAIIGDDTFVTLAGVNELAVSRAGAWQRLDVGRRPTRVTSSSTGDHVLVANTLDDSISIIDRESLKQTTISLGPASPLHDIDRGEQFFFDARLSHDRWLSCHSCHTDGHTNGRLNDNLGDGSFGAPKRVLSLRGVKDTGPWGWNGETTDLESQIIESIRTTMHGPAAAEPEERTRASDIAAFIRTLDPPARPQDSEASDRGRKVFDAQGCASCHAPPTYTSAKAYDVDLRDEVGHIRFNPPSLRGVGHGRRYLHDNRAASLEEVFVKFRHQLKHDLSENELGDLIAFLRCL